MKKKKLLKELVILLNRTSFYPIKYTPR